MYPSTSTPGAKAERVLGELSSPESGEASRVSVLLAPAPADVDAQTWSPRGVLYPLDGHDFAEPRTACC